MRSTADLRHRAGWLRAISARLASNEVAGMLAGYAEEMELRAEVEERRLERSLRPLS